MKRFMTGSMFYRLFGSFLIVILLLVLFIIVASSFFLDTIRNEITKNSSLNLDAAVHNYEEYFEHIRNLGLTLEFDSQISLLSRSASLNMDSAVSVKDQLRSNVGNSYMYLDNLLIYMKRNHYVIEKDSTAPAELMFDKLLHSKDYPLSFWEEEMEKKISFAIYPASEYWENSVGTEKLLGTFIPIMIKKVNEEDTAIFALMDASRAFDDFFLSKYDQPFAIIDKEGRPLFHSRNMTIPELPDLGVDASGNALRDNQYTFYQKGAHTGFTYVSVIPYAHVKEQLQNLTLLLIVLIILAFIISVAVSAWISRKLHAPVRHLLESFNSGEPGSFTSKIREFRFIQERINDIKKDMTIKNSLLNLYAYANQIKSIDQLSEHFQPMDKAFMVMLFHLTPVNETSSEHQRSFAQAASALREWVSGRFSEAFHDSVTLQLEQNEIVTVLHFDEGEVPEWELVLGDIVNQFNSETQPALLTIAVSPVYRSEEDFNKSYEYVSRLVKQRKLGLDPQFIAEPREIPEGIAFHPIEEQEFQLNMLQGNHAIAIPLMKRALARLSRKNGYAVHFAEFARSIVSQVVKLQFTNQIDSGRLADMASPYEAVNNCHTYEQYELCLETMIRRVCLLVQEKKAAKDDITSFVIAYVEEHYCEDISLDLIADQLNITRGYLSTYFKEKSGVNFVDYVMTYRMNKAKELLQQSNMKIQEASEKVGYMNVSTFIRVFKKHTGMTPGDFRKLPKQ
ncbi:helix-turn-helix domain-containing protein [Paenibacillus sp. HB172176]|uniref:helix-turn-helix domain-containing protein n=1 Tax=Paenibacillus sp. HB172176 TaxID=2493690 RepID=UPI00143C1AA3|nr:helix-turn-helix domain-containing protein [Paenibacillus sp. HB172176]